MQADILFLVAFNFTFVIDNLRCSHIETRIICRVVHAVNGFIRCLILRRHKTHFKLMFITKNEFYTIARQIKTSYTPKHTCEKHRMLPQNYHTMFGSTQSVQNCIHIFQNQPNPCSNFQNSDSSCAAPGAYISP